MEDKKEDTNITPAIPEQELDFYYKRSERLKRAPENVRNFYNGTAPKAPRGLFKALVHTTHGKYMLAAVGICLAVVLGKLFIGERLQVKSAAGVHFELSAFSFEDSVYVSVKALASEKFTGTASADAVFSAFGADGQALTLKKNSFIYDGKEQFCRTIFTDYDIMYVSADISVRGENTTLRAKVQRK